MKLTITRAMNELKLLKSRHSNQLQECATIAVQRGLKLRKPYSSYKPEDFEASVKSAVQSIEDIEKRIFEIKTKIDQSNNITVVKIGDKEMTVQEALVMKNLIILKKDRLSKFKRQYSSAKSEFDIALEENQSWVSKRISEGIAAGGNIGKIDPELEKRAIEDVENLYKVKFIDPLSLENLIKQLETEIEDFTNNVDFALSESNSTTFIEISD